MKIEAGMYVRTKQGSIAKVLGIDIFEEGKGTDISNLEAVYFDTMVNNIDKDIYRGCFNDIFKDAKASHNIMDLIEVGDILIDMANSKKEVLLIDNELMVRNTGLIYNNNYYLPIKSIAIKSILTKEQFEREAYKI